jgi:cytochrome c oxidase assembly protein subunit 15
MRHQHRDLAILDFPTANGVWIPDTSADTLAKINTWRDTRALSDVTAFQIWLQMAHRFGALLVLIGVLAFFIRVRAVEAAPIGQVGAIDPIARGGSVNRRYPTAADGPRLLKRLSFWWLILLFVQITLGAWTIWSNKAADIATAHVAVGAIMLSFGVIISAICWRLQSAWHGLPARGGSEHTGKMPVPQVRAA